jgi:glucose/arabinose dehydrogenase
LHAQPGVVKTTPVVAWPMTLQRVEVPAKYASLFDSTRTLSLPHGYRAKLFYIGALNKPRFMTFGADSVLYVSDFDAGGNGRVLSLIDQNKDGVADTMKVVAQGFICNHDVKFYNNKMYVTEAGKIWKCSDLNQDGFYETKEVFIDSIAMPSPTNNHKTRTLIFDSTNHKAYVSVGSSCNVCREDNRGIIEQYDDNGKNRKVFAKGVRNAVGMTLHPVTNRLWANNNGSDYQGNETPPEWVDIIRENGFYGHPFAYANQVWFDMSMHSDYTALKPITTIDSNYVSIMTEPAGLLRAHMAPMAITFLSTAFPSAIQHGLLMAMRGSWNISQPGAHRGYKIIYADLSHAQDTTINFVADFCTGFLTDSVQPLFWGRPVGIAIQGQNIYISSDEGTKCILLLYPGPSSGIIEFDKPEMILKDVFPNPAKDQLNILFTRQTPAILHISVTDLQGKQLFTTQQKFGEGDHEIQIATPFRDGIYLLKIADDKTVIVKKWVKAGN